MSTLRKWTEDEEKVVISKIEANPNNLQRAFREASLEIDRTPIAKSMFYVLMFEFMLLGVIGGLLGIFYRFLHFIAYPLGFCIYCSTF